MKIQPISRGMACIVCTAMISILGACQSNSTSPTSTNSSNSSSNSSSSSSGSTSSSQGALTSGQISFTIGSIGMTLTTPAGSAHCMVSKMGNSTMISFDASDTPHDDSVYTNMMQLNGMLKTGSAGILSTVPPDSTFALNVYNASGMGYQGDSGVVNFSAIPTAGDHLTGTFSGRGIDMNGGANSVNLSGKFDLICQMD